MRQARSAFGDQAGPGFDAGEFSSGYGGFGGFGDAEGSAGFEDIFGALFGGGLGGGAKGGRAIRPGGDIETVVTITLREAADGISRAIRLSRREPCAACSGSGATPGTKSQPCGACGGSGQVRRSQAAFSFSQMCLKCHGTGKVIASPCVRCSGSGMTRAERELSVRVPAGIVSGARLRLSGEGEPGENGGPRGDLYVRVNVAPHEFFTRDGDDLICEVPVPFHVAALGGKARVPTIKGAADLTVAPGTQNGARLRMRGLGMPGAHGQRGDEIVVVQVEVPSNLTKAQQELIEQMAAIGGTSHYPQHQRFLDRIRQAKW
jgi:molecular chaperone DnaJ